MPPHLPPSLTHPATAAWVVAAPLWVSLAALVAVAWLSRPAILPMLRLWLLARAARKRTAVVDAALVFVPQLVTPAQLFLVGIALLVVLWAGLWLLATWWMSILFAPPALVGLVRLELMRREQRYRAHLEAALPPAVSRLAMQMASGQGFQTVLRRLSNDLPPTSPLGQEWRWLLARLGAPLRNGSLATAPQVVEALRLQTTSPSHRTLLEHVGVALGQTQDVLSARLKAAADALYAAERRRSTAQTELAQMKYSGWFVGGAGLALVAYIASIATERVVQVYSHPVLGVIAGVCASTLFAPIVGGMLLARVDAVEY